MDPESPEARRAAAEKLAADHELPVRELHRLLDQWYDEIRGHGWLDAASRKRVVRLAERIDALRTELDDSGHVRHAVMATDVPELLAQAAEQLRATTARTVWEGGAAAPGRGQRVRPDELWLVWEATDLWRGCRPEASVGHSFDHTVSPPKPGNAYTRWIEDLLREAGVQREARSVLDQFRHVDH